jgi:hypothetical protein
MAQWQQVVIAWVTTVCIELGRALRLLRYAFKILGFGRRFGERNSATASLSRLLRQQRMIKRCVAVPFDHLAKPCALNVEIISDPLHKSTERHSAVG